jgi:cyclase
MRSARLLLLGAALTWGLALGASAQTPAAPAPAPAPAPLAVKTVKPNLYMVVGAGGNSTVLVTAGGVILVDSKNSGQAIYDGLMGAIASVSGGKPVRWLIDTHHHADHTGNNARFLAAGVKVIGQKNMPRELAKFTPPPTNPAATAPARPNVTYDQNYEIRLGGETARLLHYGPAHTNDDTIVYFPQFKVVSTGDELNAATPNFDYLGGASIAGWIGSLDQVLKLDWDLAVPGHGDKPMTRAEVVAFRDKLATLLQRAREQVKAGTPKAALIAAINWDGLWTFSPAFWAGPGRLDGFYAEASR